MLRFLQRAVGVARLSDLLGDHVGVRDFFKFLRISPVHLRRLRLLIRLHFLVAINVEHINDTVATASPSHKVRVVRVDIAVLYSDQVLDHGVGGRELLVEEPHHYLDDLFFEGAEAG